MQLARVSFAPKYLVHRHLEVGHLAVIAVDPHRAVVGEQRLDLQQAVAQHSQPDGVFEGVVVVQEGLLRIEGRVEVGELDLAQVFARELRQLGQAVQGVQGVAADQQVVARPRARRGPRRAGGEPRRRGSRRAGARA